MKKLLIAALFALFVVPAGASEMDANMSLGLDFALPYTMTVDGNSVKERANFNIGLDGRYWMDENMNLGVRFMFDIEEKGTSARQMALMPGFQYRWMPGEMFMPFARIDLPVILRGAANTAGSNSKMDIGFGGGIGLAMNMGEMMGVENFMIRYDFAFAYTLGMGDAVPVFGIDIFKIGFDYQF